MLVGDGGRVSFVDRQSSLIETSITVPAVNATFYACARGARSYLVAIGRYSFSAKEFISIRKARPVAARFDRSNIDAKSPRHVPFVIPCHLLPLSLGVPFYSRKLKFTFILFAKIKEKIGGAIGTSDLFVKA